MHLHRLLAVIFLAFVCVACGPSFNEIGGDLATDGLTVYEIDDQVLVVLATDRLFKLERPDQINPAMYEQISRLAKIIKYDQPAKVEIFAYANQGALADESMRLTQQQARTMAAYLWNQGVDPKSMIYKGFGKKYPVASAATPSADFANNRIEVRWRVGSGYSA